MIGENGNDSIIVFFHNEERIGVKQLRNWSEDNMGSKLIIVSLEGPTAFTKKEADQNYPNVQFFTFQNMSVNITKHTLVPKHEKITYDSIKHLYAVNSSEEWPKLYRPDPISQYYNFKDGDLIRISRTLGYPEPVYYYRLVCNPPVS